MTERQTNIVPLAFATFHAWVAIQAERDPMAVLGEIKSRTECPLAKHARALGFTNVCINAGSIFLDDQVYRHAPWTDEFIIRHDDNGGDFTITTRTAGEVLAIVNAMAERRVTSPHS